MQKMEGITKGVEGAGATVGCTTLGRRSGGAETSGIVGEVELGGKDASREVGGTVTGVTIASREITGVVDGEETDIG